MKFLCSSLSHYYHWRFGTHANGFTGSVLIHNRVAQHNQAGGFPAVDCVKQLNLVRFLALRQAV